MPTELTETAAEMPASAASQDEDARLATTSARVRLAFLTSNYAKQSYTFMRQEVTGLRALGWDVRTFSIREPSPSEIVDEDVRREHERTTYILSAGVVRLLLAVMREFVSFPSRFLRAVGLAMLVSTPGVKGRLWPLAYVVEAAYLAGLVRGLGVRISTTTWGGTRPRWPC